jgi:hypothetical protein
MSRWRKMPKQRRVLYLTVVALSLLAIAVVSAPWSSASTSIAIDDPGTPATNLEAPLPPPEAVFLEKISFGDYGNARVIVQLNQEQVAQKLREGTADFIIIGPPSNPILLTDDGQNADATAGDGYYSATAWVDSEELAARANRDKEAAERSGGKVTVFAGRSVAGEEAPVPFDSTGFESGKRVPLNPAVVFNEPETEEPVTTDPGTTETSAPLPVNKAVVAGMNTYQRRVLMIRDVGVVRDPSRTYDPCTNTGNQSGIWTFRHLMTQMANQTASGIDPAVFTENWLRHWVANQTVNSFTVPSRVQMQQLINQWKAGGAQLDMSRSPLRLLAIVPRVDLRRSTTGGGGYTTVNNGTFIDAGELRFIFGFVLRPGWTLSGGYSPSQAPSLGGGCRALPFSVILEYRVPKCNCESVKAWAQRWDDLVNFAPGPGSVYNSRLAALTEAVVRAGVNPARPNGNALGQLRTNEIALTTPWELREFQLTQFPFSMLTETTTADTAHDSFNNTALFQSWIQTRVGPPLFGPNWNQPIPQVPLFFQGGNFLGANPRVPSTAFFWNAPGLNLLPNGGNNKDNWGRHRASLAACNGCHAKETRTSFVHVDPSTPGLPANLSQFLTGTVPPIPDPAAGIPSRTFDDLARREQDLKRAKDFLCLRFQSADAAHVRDSVASTGRVPADVFNGAPALPVHKMITIALEDAKANHIFEVH